MTTNTPVSTALAAVRNPRPTLTLAWLWFRLETVETFRLPAFLIMNSAFPTVMFLYVTITNQVDTENVAAANTLLGQISVLSVILSAVCLLGTGIAISRMEAFDAYARTLPTGAIPQLLGRLLNSFFFGLVVLVPVVLVAILTTNVTLSPGEALLGASVILLCLVVFGTVGVLLGYVLPAKVGLTGSLIVAFGFILLGGLYSSGEFPAGLEAVSLATPGRAARDLMSTALGNSSNIATGHSLIVVAIWSAACLVLFLLAYSRDEGRRFK